MRQVILFFLLVALFPHTGLAKMVRQEQPAQLRNALTDVSIAFERRAAAIAAESRIFISFAETPQLDHRTAAPHAQHTSKFVGGIVLTSLGATALLLGAACLVVAGNSGPEDAALFGAMGVVFLLAAAGLSIPGIIMLSKYAPRRRQGSDY